MGVLALLYFSFIEFPTITIFRTEFLSWINVKATHKRKNIDSATVCPNKTHKFMLTHFVCSLQIETNMWNRQRSAKHSKVLKINRFFLWVCRSTFEHISIELTICIYLDFEMNWTISRRRELLKRICDITVVSRMKKKKWFVCEYLYECRVNGRNANAYQSL